MQEAVLELHQALLCSWPTTCNPPHQAMLRLTVSREQKKSEKGIKTNDIEFDVTFSAHCRKWAETKFAIRSVIPATIEIMQP
jgi:hypothetical protein